MAISTCLSTLYLKAHIKWRSSDKSLIRLKCLHVSSKKNSHIYFDERERFEKGKCGCCVGNMGNDDGAQITTLRTADTHNMGEIYTHKH